MKLLLVNSCRARISEPWLKRWLAGLSRQLAKQGLVDPQFAKKEVVVVLVNRSEIQRLNRLYRKKNYPTDILSFAGADADSAGELILCMPVIRAQAKETGLGARGELGFMLIHGVLHLLGFDHMKASEKKTMFDLQEQLYAELSKRVGLVDRSRVG